MLSLQSWRWRCKPASHAALRRGLALLPKLHSLRHLIPEAAWAVAGAQSKEAATLGPAPSFVHCLTVALCLYGGPGLLCTPLLTALQPLWAVSTRPTPILSPGLSSKRKFQHPAPTCTHGRGRLRLGSTERWHVVVLPSEPLIPLHSSFPGSQVPSRFPHPRLVLHRFTGRSFLSFQVFKVVC